ncbi:MAG: GWxTD domain-containing protein, partial [Calditrichaeota bacterium]|nr:GWxTD domain-containing protein [Calditrichota bacterium]
MRRTATIFVLLLGLLVSGVQVGNAADRRQTLQADSLLVAGDAWFAKGDLDRAEKLYKQAKALGANLALGRLGQVALKRGDWGLAKSYFKELLKTGADDTLAHYGLGVAQRELGAQRAGLMRLTEWGFSEEHFRWVLNADSSYRDVLYQLAVLERYRKHYFRAVSLGLEQLRRHPEDDDSRFGLFDLYDYLIEHVSPDTAEGWLLHEGSTISKYFLGELYRRHQAFDRAEKIFKELLEEKLPFPKQPVLLSLARCYYEQNNSLLADEYYWQAVRSIKSDLAARFVFEDVKYILSEGELYEYQRAKTPQQKIAFFRKIWEKRNPRPGSPDNARIGEHYRRLIYAEKNFRFDGFRLPVNNPDVGGFLQFPKTFYLNSKLNDKGLIYVRYGEPDRKATALGEDLVHNESWLYAANLPQPLMFHFEIDADGAPNNWRLVPVPTDDRLLESREDWDPLFSRYLHGSRMTRDELLNEIANRSREDVVIGLNSDRHTWRRGVEPIQCPFQLVTFKGKNRETELDLFYGIPEKAARSRDGAADTLWESGAAVFDAFWNKVGSEHRISSVIWSDSTRVRDGVYVGSHTFTLVPARYRLGFYAEGLDHHRIAGWKLTLKLADYSGSRVRCSDVLLAYDVSPEPRKDWWTRGSVSIFPNPSARFRVGSPVYTYWEVYNLAKGQDGLRRYAVELAVEKLSGSSGGLKTLFG